MLDMQSAIHMVENAARTIVMDRSAILYFAVWLWQASTALMARSTSASNLVVIDKGSLETTQIVIWQFDQHNAQVISQSIDGPRFLTQVLPASHS